MFPTVISNPNSISQNHHNNTNTISSTLISRVQNFGALNSMPLNNPSHQHPQKPKKKRNLPGNPDPEAEVIALSPKTLMATNRFVCEICSKGFQRDQNLQLHRRGHNLPWKLKQRSGKEIVKKRAYVCPEPSCLHHHPSRALGDLTGIKKHYCRKHGEKKWKCDKCSKVYAVQSDWKAHAKTCGTREYRCDCGAIFSRKDSFITHRAFCDALAEESARLSAATNSFMQQNPNITAHFHFNPQNLPPPPPLLPFSGQHHPWETPSPQNHNPVINHSQNIKHESGLHVIDDDDNIPNLSNYQDHMRTHMMTSPFGHHLHVAPLPPLSATALLQKAAATVGSKHVGSTMAHLDEVHVGSAWQNNDGDDDRFTRDFLGLSDGGSSVRDQMLTYTGGVKFAAYDDDDQNESLILKHHYHQGFGFSTETCPGWGNC